MQQIAVLTRGLWRLRREIEAMSGMVPVRWDTLPRPAFDAVAGWGHAPTTARARRLARRIGVPYVAFEDGPLRSVRPGPSEPPSSLVMDRAGIYYDAAHPSDLTALIATGLSLPDGEARAADAAAMLRRLRLSKYNSGPLRDISELGLAAGVATRVLVLDQVENDASIRGALADGDSFKVMLEAAREENPKAEIVVKLHPDVLSGRRAGYFSDIRPEPGLTLVAAPANPWSLIEAVGKVYTVSSGLGFEAAVAGKAVVTFGSPFYAGFGFTDDRRLSVARPGHASALDLFAAYYLRYTHYFDAYSRHEIAFEEAAEQLAWLRDRFHEQAHRPVGYRITRWKRASVARMLDGPAGRPLHATGVARAIALAKETQGPVVAWASRDTSQLETACAAANVKLMRVEDGFVRSAGLGASFVPPLSLVFDAHGIFYDSRTPSDLEALLEGADIPPDLIARAARLRARLVAAGTTKYNVGARADALPDARGRPFVLVPGQVEDDASIAEGSPALQRNVDLLEAVRARHPNAFVVYKPHPDVEAGFRNGRVAGAQARRFADAIVTQASILGLIARADRVETMTSLAGFEALLRGKPVTTHGQPFYAGWGLTEDLCPLSRRTRRRTLDELVAAALILYPRYLDPVSRRRCGPELLIERLAADSLRERSAGERAMGVVRAAAARALHAGRSLRLRARGGP